jgi:hypothetical protein
MRDPVLASETDEPRGEIGVAEPELVTRPLGRRGFIVGGAAAATTAAALASMSSPVAAAAAPTRYVALTPLRLCDTRPGAGRNFGYRRVGSKVTRVEIAGRTIGDVTVPADATAAVFTVVGINRAAGGNYLSAYPAGSTWPGTSSVNMPSLNAASPNLVTVQLGSGSVDILANKPADIVLDLAGVYVPADGGRSKEGRYREIALRRVTDTRNQAGKPGPGSNVRVDLTSLKGSAGLTDDAIAVSVNLTAAAPSGPGYLTAYPFGESRPPTSSLNVRPGVNRAIGAIVKLGVDAGRIGFNVFVENGAHVIVDVTGYFTGPDDFESPSGLFVPVTPVRLMDTRKGQGGKKRLWAGWTRAFSMPSAYRNDAGTAVLNVTAARTMARGFFSVNAAQTRSGAPTTSSLNVSGSNETVANHVVSRISTAGLEVYSSSGGDAIADLVGYYKGTEAGATRAVPPEPAPPAIAPPYWVVAPSISRMNAGRTVASGASANATVNSGRIWHWTGTGYVGNGSRNIGTFGHRTDAGGPLYFADDLKPGDRIYVSTGDQRTYVYKYNRRELTSSNNAQILAATQRLRGESLSLIACTVGFDSTKSAYPDRWAATSLKYRIIVTFSLEYWTDDIPLQ